MDTGEKHLVLSKKSEELLESVYKHLEQFCPKIKDGVAGGRASRISEKESSTQSVSDLSSYLTGFHSQVKEVMIRKVAEAVFKTFGSTVSSTAPIKDVIRELTKLVSNIRKGWSSKVNNSSSLQSELCKKFTTAINANFGHIIDTSADPAIQCNKVYEFIMSLLSGMQSEFVAISGDVSQILKNMKLVKDLLASSYEKQLEAVQQSGDQNTISRSSSIKEVYDKLNTELDRQMYLLSNLIDTTIKPVNKSLVESLQENGEMEKLISDLKGNLGTTEFGNMLSYSLQGVSSIAFATDKLRDALQKLGLDLGKLKSSNISNYGELKKRVFTDFVEMSKQGKMDLDNIVDSFNIVMNGDFTDEVVKKLLNKSGGTDMTSGGYKYEETPDGRSAFNKKRSLKTKIEDKRKVREAVLVQFKNALKNVYFKIVDYGNTIARKIGTSISVTDDLKEFISAFTSIEGVNRDNIAEILSGYRKDYVASYSRENFRSRYEQVYNMLKPLTESGAESSVFKNMQMAIAELIKLMDDFKDNVVKDLSGVNVQSPEEIREEIKSSASTVFGGSGDALFGSGKYAAFSKVKKELEYYLAIANIRSNLQKVSEDIKTYSKDYESILGEEAAWMLDKIQAEYKPLFEYLYDKVDEATGEDKLFYESLIDFYKRQRDAKTEMVRTAESVDMYLKSFTEGLVSDIESEKSLVKLLNEIEIVAKWFNDRSGDNLVTLVNVIGDAAQADKVVISEKKIVVPTAVLTDPAKNNYLQGQPFTKKTDVSNQRRFVRGIFKLTENTIRSMRAIENLLRFFEKVGEKFKGVVVKTNMTPGQIRNNIEEYILTSAFTTKPGDVSGEELYEGRVKDIETYERYTKNRVKNEISELRNDIDVKYKSLSLKGTELDDTLSKLESKVKSLEKKIDETGSSFDIITEYIEEVSWLNSAKVIAYYIFRLAKYVYLYSENIDRTNTPFYIRECLHRLRREITAADSGISNKLFNILFKFVSDETQLREATLMDFRTIPMSIRSSVLGGSDHKTDRYSGGIDVDNIFLIKKFPVLSEIMKTLHEYVKASKEIHEMDEQSDKDQQIDEFTDIDKIKEILDGEIYPQNFNEDILLIDGMRVVQTNFIKPIPAFENLIRVAKDTYGRMIHPYSQPFLRFPYNINDLMIKYGVECVIYKYIGALLQNIHANFHKDYEAFYNANGLEKYEKSNRYDLALCRVDDGGKGDYLSNLPLCFLVGYKKYKDVNINLFEDKCGANILLPNLNTVLPVIPNIVEDIIVFFLISPYILQKPTKIHVADVASLSLDGKKYIPARPYDNDRRRKEYGVRINDAKIANYNRNSMEKLNELHNLRQVVENLTADLNGEINADPVVINLRRYTDMALTAVTNLYRFRNWAGSFLRRYPKPIWPAGLPIPPQAHLRMPNPLPSNPSQADIDAYNNNMQAWITYQDQDAKYAAAINVPANRARYTTYSDQYRTWLAAMQATGWSEQNINAIFADYNRALNYYRTVQNNLNNADQAIRDRYQDQIDKVNAEMQKLRDDRLEINNQLNLKQNENNRIVGELNAERLRNPTRRIMVGGFDVIDRVYEELTDDSVLDQKEKVPWKYISIMLRPKYRKRGSWIKGNYVESITKSNEVQNIKITDDDCDNFSKVPNDTLALRRFIDNKYALAIEALVLLKDDLLAARSHGIRTENLILVTLTEIITMWSRWIASTSVSGAESLLKKSAALVGLMVNMGKNKMGLMECYNEFVTILDINDALFRTNMGITDKEPKLSFEPPGEDSFKLLESLSDPSTEPPVSSVGESKKTLHMHFRGHKLTDEEINKIVEQYKADGIPLIPSSTSVVTRNADCMGSYDWDAIGDIMSTDTISDELNLPLSELFVSTLLFRHYQIITRQSILRLENVVPFIINPVLNVRNIDGLSIVIGDGERLKIYLSHPFYAYATAPRFKKRRHMRNHYYRLNLLAGHFRQSFGLACRKINTPEKEKIRTRLVLYYGLIGRNRYFVEPGNENINRNIRTQKRTDYVVASNKINNLINIRDILSEDYKNEKDDTNRKNILDNINAQLNADGFDPVTGDIIENDSNRVAHFDKLIEEQKTEKRRAFEVAAEIGDQLDQVEYYDRSTGDEKNGLQLSGGAEEKDTYREMINGNVNVVFSHISKAKDFHLLFNKKDRVDIQNNPDRFFSTDYLFVSTMKSIVSKILTVVKVFSLFNRPLKTNDAANYGKFSSLSAVRMIVGAGEQPNRKNIIPEAFDLYIRLPLLVEWYKNHFARRNGYSYNASTATAGPTSAVIQPDEYMLVIFPNIEGVWANLVSIIFDKYSYVEQGNYSENAVEKIIDAINQIYTFYKNKDSKTSTSYIMNAFVGEMNRLFGFIKRADYEEYFNEQYENTQSKDDISLEEDNLNFDILNADNQYGRMPGPSDKYLTNPQVTRKRKQEMTQHLVQAVNQFRDSIDAEIKSVSINLDQAKSLSNSILTHKREFAATTSLEDKYKLVSDIIQGTNNFLSTNLDKTVMIHETVIVPIFVLIEITKIVNGLIIDTFNKPIALYIKKIIDLVNYSNKLVTLNIDVNGGFGLDFTKLENVCAMLIKQVKSNILSLGNDISSSHFDKDKMTMLITLIEDRLIEDLFKNDRTQYNSSVIKTIPLTKNYLLSPQFGTDIQAVNFYNLFAQMIYGIDLNIVNDTTHVTVNDFTTFPFNIIPLNTNEVSNEDKAFINRAKEYIHNTHTTYGVLGWTGTSGTHDGSQFNAISQAPKIIMDKKDTLVSWNRWDNAYRGGAGRGITTYSTTLSDSKNIQLPYQTNLIYIFNKALASLIRDSMDDAGAAPKLYIKLIDTFVTGPAAREIRQDGAYPNVTKFTTPPKSVSGELAGPDYNSVVYASNALTLFGIIASIDQKTRLKKHLFNTFTEIPDYLKDRMKCILPFYIKLFDVIYNRAETIKKVMNSKRIKDKIIAPTNQVDLRDIYGDDSWKVKPTQVDLHKLVAGEDPAKYLTGIVTHIMNLCTTLKKSIEGVYKELDDSVPYFAEVNKDFITDYKQRYGMIPLMPPSHLLAPYTFFGNSLSFEKVGSSTVNTPSDEYPTLPNRFNGSFIYKYNYATRSILTRSDAEITFDQLIGAKDIYSNYIGVSNKKMPITQRDYETFITHEVRAIRFLNDTSLIRLLFGGYDASDISPENTDLFQVIPQLKEVSDKDSEPKITEKNIIKPLLKLYQLTHGVEDIVNHIENTDKKESKKELFDININSNEDRQKQIIMNILDMGIVPINIHAFMREVPFTNLMNYAYTFDRYIDEILTGPNHAWQRDMLKNPYSEKTPSEFITPMVNRDPLPKYVHDQIYKKILVSKNELCNVKLIRNLIWVSELQLITRKLLVKYLSWIDTPVVQGLKIANPIITEFVRKDRPRPDEYDKEDLEGEFDEY